VEEAEQALANYARANNIFTTESKQNLAVDIITKAPQGSHKGEVRSVDFIAYCATL
jgi:hypothetical protein